jgi:N-ethylmaleimide reductase
MSPDPLFQPLALGAIPLPSRVVMAPMTRSRAGAGGVPTPLMAQYYAQRASAALIVAEMTHVSADGAGYVGVPGIHDIAQLAGWRAVTRAVHAAGGRIVLQLGHSGRVSHPSLQPDGATPVAPSAIRPSGTVYTATGPQPFVTPRALELHELPRIVDAFADATRLARIAGFDGVEVHAGNGYLLDQFLRDGTNRRADAYGGTAERRARLLLEVLEAVAGAWSADRVGVRVSPLSAFNDMSDRDPAGTFAQLARRLRGRGLAYLHVVEPPAGASAERRLTAALRHAFDGAVIANEGFAAQSARDALARGEADAVSFGAPFIANPDLPCRLALGAPLAVPDRSTFYGGDARGFTDYPTLAAAAAA